MNSSERPGDTGAPDASAPAASVSSETFSHPSLRPRFFHRPVSTASASCGSANDTSLSAATLATLITIALMAADEAARGARRIGTWNRTCEGRRRPGSLIRPAGER